MISSAATRTSGSTTVRRSCSSRWSASEVGVPTKFSYRVSSCSSCWTRVRSSGGPKMTSEMSNGQVGGRFARLGRRHLGRRLGARTLGRGLSLAVALGAGRVVRRSLLEEGVLLQLLLQELLELHRGELQEVDRLLEHRRHDEPLGLAEAETGFHGHRQASYPAATAAWGGACGATSAREARARTSHRGRSPAPSRWWPARGPFRTPGSGRRRGCRTGR